MNLLTFPKSSPESSTIIVREDFLYSMDSCFMKSFRLVPFEYKEMWGVIYRGQGSSYFLVEKFLPISFVA